MSGKRCKRLRAMFKEITGRSPRKSINEKIVVQVRPRSITVGSGVFKEVFQVSPVKTYSMLGMGSEWRDLKREAYR